MAFVVSSLADYTRQNAESLFMASHFDAKTQQLIMNEGNVMTKVKSAETINLIATEYKRVLLYKGYSKSDFIYL